MLRGEQEKGTEGVESRGWVERCRGEVARLRGRRGREEALFPVPLSPLTRCLGVLSLWLAPGTASLTLESEDSRPRSQRVRQS